MQGYREIICQERYYLILLIMRGGRYVPALLLVWLFESNWGQQWAGSPVVAGLGRVDRASVRTVFTGCPSFPEIGDPLHRATTSHTAWWGSRAWLLIRCPRVADYSTRTGQTWHWQFCCKIFLGSGPIGLGSDYFSLARWTNATRIRRILGREGGRGARDGSARLLLGRGACLSCRRWEIGTGRKWERRTSCRTPGPISCREENTRHGQDQTRRAGRGVARLRTGTAREEGQETASWQTWDRGLPGSCSLCMQRQISGQPQPSGTRKAPYLIKYAGNQVADEG